MKIYLSGGMHSGWQKTVKDRLHMTIYDPRDHQFSHPQSYTAWDRLAIQKCDLVLAYMENDNPSGIGMALEVGYARALNKIS